MDSEHLSKEAKAAWAACHSAQDFYYNINGKHDVREHERRSAYVAWEQAWKLACEAQKAWQDSLAKSA